MKYGMAFVLAAIVLGALIGCDAQPPGTSRSLGAAPMAKAFEVSRTVMSQFFPVESEDARKGLVLCRPDEMSDPNDRLLGSTPARNVARLQLRMRGNEVFASVQVRHERQVLTTQREANSGHTYSGVPNDPAVGDVEVRKSIRWNLVRYDRERENAILDDIVNAMNGKATSQPATRASTSTVQKPPVQPG